MFDTFTRISETTGVEPQMLIAAGVFLGAFLVFLSLVMTFQERAGARTLQRMSAAGDATAGLFVAPEADPSSIAKAFLPAKRRERAKVRRDLAHAGFTGPNAVIKYYMIRVGIGLLLPAALAAMILLRDQLPLPSSIDIQLSKIGPRQMMIGLGIMILIGFYGPAIWLSARATERRERIEQNFPNALDLLQVSVESGLGFDAALSRVATELSVASPDATAMPHIRTWPIASGLKRPLLSSMSFFNRFASAPAWARRYLPIRPTCASVAKSARRRRPTNCRSTCRRSWPVL